MVRNAYAVLCVRKVLTRNLTLKIIRELTVGKNLSSVTCVQQVSHKIFILKVTENSYRGKTI